MALVLAVVQTPVKKVLVIGIDGCRPDALIAAKTPNIDSLVADGAWSIAKADPITVSGPCWSSMLCGVWDDKHGVKDNGFAGSDYKDYPDFLTLLKRYRPNLRTVAITAWKPIIDSIIKSADYKGPLEPGDDAVVQQALYELDRNSPDVMFLHFDDVDHAGHTYGFDPKNEDYLASIEATDERIGAVLDGVRQRATYETEDWLIIVVSDHGGSGTSHGQNIPEHVNVPFIVSGRDAAAFTIVPDQTDVAPTVFAFLGIKPGPEVDWDGVPVGLKGIDSKALEQASEDGTVKFGAKDDFFIGATDVPLSVRTEGAEIRTTTDGSVPGPHSPAVQSVHVEDGTVTIRARAFMGGQPVGPSSMRTFRSQKALYDSTEGSFSAGLLYRVLEGKFTSVNGLDFTRSTRGGIAATPTPNAAGSAEDFAIEFTGLVNANQDGVYDFALYSDDGARLWIDGALVVDHDGLHSASAAVGPVGLKKGWHRLRIVYFQAGGDMALRLAMGMRGTVLQTVPIAGFAHAG